VADFVQLPGVLNVTAVNGDECNIALSLQRNISGYSWESYVYRSEVTTTGGGVGSLSGLGVTVVQPTIGISDTANGTMVIGLNETQTRSLTPGVGYRWYLRWVAPGQITRTIVSGNVTTVAP
jgi:hypothetical protein